MSKTKPRAGGPRRPGGSAPVEVPNLKTPAGPAPAATPKARASASRLRRDRTENEPQPERLTVYLPPDLAEEVRVLCVRERRSLSDAAEEAFRLLLEGRRAPTP